MSELQLALIFSLLAISGNLYLFWLYFSPSRRGAKRVKDIELYFHIMKQLGYKNEEWIIDHLSNFKEYIDLEKHNKEAKEKLKIK